MAICYVRGIKYCMRHIADCAYYVQKPVLISELGFTCSEKILFLQMCLWYTANIWSIFTLVQTDDVQSFNRCVLMMQRMANNFSTFQTMVPPLLNAVNLAHRVMGSTPLEKISTALNKVSRNYIPAWNQYMPKGASKLPSEWIVFVC